MMKSFFRAAALVAVVAVAILPFLSHAKTTMTTAGYQPPVSGADLAKYCSHPHRHLIMVTKQGTIKIQLFDKLAPHHVAQISQLAKDHFYDGTTFHRVIPGFMIQGGDPNSRDNDLNNDGMGGYGKTLNAEFSAVHHDRGICSMARTADPNSASSQFFIMHNRYPSLDNQYTVWGQVVEGIEVVDKIVNLKKVQGDNPGKAAEITKCYIEEGK